MSTSRRVMVEPEREPLLPKNGGWESINGETIRIVPRRSIVVEPLLLLYALSGMPLVTLKSQYMYQRIAADMGVHLNNLSGNGTELCDSNTTDPGYIARESVQAANTQWNMYIAVANYFPAVVMILVYGSFSDKMGRRLTLIAPVLGSIASIFVQLAIVYFDLPVWCLLFGAVEYLFGGFYVLITGSFSYIADTVPKEKRAIRMTILDAIILGNAAVGSVSVGYMINIMGYFYPYLFCLAGKLLTLCYAVFFIPETIKKQPKSSRPPVNIFENLKTGIKLCLVDNGEGRRIQLCIILLCYVVGEMISTTSLLTLYQMNAPLCWGSILIGYFGAANDLVKALGMVVTAFILKKWLSEKWLVVMGLVSNLCYYLYLSFATSAVMMFLSVILGSLTFLYIPMMRAIMSKLVKPDEQGSLFAVMMVMSSTAMLFSTLTSNKIYSATLLIMEGFVFLVGAATKFFALLIFCGYLCLSRKRTKILAEHDDTKTIVEPE